MHHEIQNYAHHYLSKINEVQNVVFLNKYDIVFHSTQNDVGQLESHKIANKQMWCNTLPEGNIEITGTRKMQSMNTYVVLSTCNLIRINNKNDAKNQKIYFNHFSKCLNNYELNNNNYRSYNGFGLLLKIYNDCLHKEIDWLSITHTIKQQRYNFYRIDGYYTYDNVDKFDFLSFKKLSHYSGCNTLNELTHVCPEIMLIDHNAKLLKLFYINMENINDHGDKNDKKNVIITSIYMMLSYINNYNPNYWYHDLKKYNFDKKLIKEELKFVEPAKLIITNNYVKKIIDDMSETNISSYLLFVNTLQDEINNTPPHVIQSIYDTQMQHHDDSDMFKMKYMEYKRKYLTLKQKIGSQTQ